MTMCSFASVLALQLLVRTAASNDESSHFVRREAGISPQEEDRLTHNVHNMFSMLDLDGDGLITTPELKKTMEKKHVHLETVTSLLERAEGSAGTNFEQFNEIVHRVAAKGVLRHISKHHTAHQHGDPSWNISCGGHKAASCEACPTTDSTGQTVANHYAEWCHGDCEYNPADSTCNKKGAVTVSGTHTVNASHTTSPVPDLLNPNHTAEDTKVVEAATEAAIREERLENKQKEEEKEESKKFNWNTFWLIVCITFGSIVAICCIASIVAAVVIYGMPNAGKQLEEEGDADADAAGEGEASAASEDSS